MAVPRCAWGRSRRTPVPTPHSEGQPPRLATPAVGPLRHLVPLELIACPRGLWAWLARRPQPDLEATQAILAEAERRQTPAERIVCTDDVVAYAADAKASGDLVCAAVRAFSAAATPRTA